MKITLNEADIRIYHDLMSFDNIDEFYNEFPPIKLPHDPTLGDYLLNLQYPKKTHEYMKSLIEEFFENYRPFIDKFTLIPSEIDTVAVGYLQIKAGYLIISQYPIYWI